MSPDNAVNTAKKSKSFDILSAIGRTPIIRIGNVYAKFEGANLMQDSA